MRFKMICLATAFMLFTTSPFACVAGDTGWIATGAGAGVSGFDSHQYLEQYQIYGVYRLPWSAQAPRGWVIDTGLNATAGALSSGGDTGCIVSAGPKITLTRSDQRFSPLAGGSLVFLSRDTYGRIDFGGPFQFLTYIGMNFRISRHLSAEYQFQHMSNAHIYDTNPGMEMHLIQLGYCF